MTTIFSGSTEISFPAVTINPRYLTSLTIKSHFFKFSFSPAFVSRSRTYSTFFRWSSWKLSLQICISSKLLCRIHQDSLVGDYWSNFATQQEHLSSRKALPIIQIYLRLSGILFSTHLSLIRIRWNAALTSIFVNQRAWEISRNVSFTKEMGYIAFLMTALRDRYSTQKRRPSPGFLRTNLELH